MLGSNYVFTGHVIDLQETQGICGLCGQKHLRYQFEIKDREGVALYVGSSCILKFKVKVLKDGRELLHDEAKKELHRIKEMRRLSDCLIALKKVAVADNNQILFNALRYYKNHKCLTPRFAFVVFWKLREHKIEFCDSFFKVTLAKKKDQDAIKEMEESRIAYFWKSLKSSQKASVISKGKCLQSIEHFVNSLEHMN